jgi:hypothetical protein
MLANSVFAVVPNYFKSLAAQPHVQKLVWSSFEAAVPVRRADEMTEEEKQEEAEDIAE